jgi:predicted transcriptional regulator
MKIGELVSHDEAYVQPFTSVGAVEGKLAARGYVVIMDQGKFVGILTAADALSSGHNLVVDCYREKPLIRADEDAELIMARMLREGLQVLPVVDDKADYLGCVQTSQVLRRVLDITKQTATIELKSVNLDESSENGKESFSSDLFHNTRNQLQAIVSAVDMLRMSPGAFEREMLLKSIESNARLLDELITTIHASHFGQD